jgi:HSP20 family protein
MDLVPWDQTAPGDLWDAFDGLRGEMERALGLFKLPEASGLLDRTTAPALDVLETGGEFLVWADVPGIKKEDLELSVTGTLLTIKGNKKAAQNSDKHRIFRKETWAGSFSRTIDLPENIDLEKLTAELKDGVLTVHIGKREEARTKAITVKVQ